MGNRRLRNSMEDLEEESRQADTKAEEAEKRFTTHASQRSIFGGLRNPPLQSAMSRLLSDQALQAQEERMKKRRELAAKKRDITPEDLINQIQMTRR